MRSSWGLLIGPGIWRNAPTLIKQSVDVVTLVDHEGWTAKPLPGLGGRVICGTKSVWLEIGRQEGEYEGDGGK